jgi:predicted ribosomally synthesized peptide with SipW-like signal peptide
MKGRLGKFGFILLALALCLSITGAAFAKWSDTVTINGTVNTGTVSVGIHDLWLLDQGPDPQQSPGCNTKLKDIANHTSVNDGAVVCTRNITGLGPTDFVDSVTETITNAYPYYKSGTTLMLCNCGSIPVKIDDIDLAYVSGDKALLDYITIGHWNIFTYNDITGDWPLYATGEGWGSLETMLSGYQLESEPNLSVYFEFYFEEEVGGVVMPQDSSVTFTITVTASQWNEVS